MTSTPDAITQAVYDLLTAGTYIGASVSLGDMLPTEVEELPAIGVYLVDDKRDNSGFAANSMSQDRVATVRCEIRAVGEMLAATLALRTAVLSRLLADDSLAGLAHQVSFGTMQPFTVPTDVRVSGADLDFEISYLFRH